MKAERISTKDYELLLKTMRRWPQPYLGIVAKLIAHLSWQFNEIERLKARLDKLEQPELLNEESKLIGAFPGSVIRKQHDPKPSTAKPPKVYTTPAERVSYIFYNYGTSSKEWSNMLRLKEITNEEAVRLMDSLAT